MSLRVYLTAVRPTTVFEAGITHNLNTMAKEAGIYQHLWRPEELNITKARDLILPLQEGLKQLQDTPARFTALNPKNGWGNYEDLVLFVATYLEACRKDPDADILTYK